MLRVSNGVLVVPPFECAWLTGDGYTLQNGSGCVSFEARGDTDVTVILKSTPGAKRLQPLLRQAPGHAQSHGGGGNALQVEENYTVIFGSHRNSCLKIEKTGVTQCMVTGVACSRVSSKAFSKYWIDFNHGVLTVGHGEPGEGVCHRWHDTQEIPGIQHVGLSCWDRHVSYRSISLQTPLNPARLQQLLQEQQGASGGGGAASDAGAGGGGAVVPSLFDTTCAAIMTSTTPANVCRTLHVAELLLPTTLKLYRYCLDYIARHFEAVTGAQTAPGAGNSVGTSTTPLPAALASGSSTGDGVGSPKVEADTSSSLQSLTPAAMCDLVCQNTFSVDEQGIFLAVRGWALSYLAAAAAEREAEASSGAATAVGGDGSAFAAGTGCRQGSRAATQGRRRPGSRQTGTPRWSNDGTGGGGCSPTSPASPRASYFAAPALGRVSAPSGGAAGGPEACAPQSAGADFPAITWGTAGPGSRPRPAGGSPRRVSAPQLDLDSLSTALQAAAAVTGGVAASTPPPVGTPMAAADAVAAAAAAEDEAVVCRVLSLIRFPLLPIRQLHACLEDPLVRRLTPILDLVHEALEVHRRETGAGLEPSSGSGTRLALTAPAPAGVAYTRAASLPPASPAAERRLVKPLPAGGGAEGAVAATAAPAGGAAGAGTGAAGGGTGGAAGAAGSWSVRYQRRCLPFALELEYVCDGDSSGVLHFLGTQYGSQGWVNPMLAKRVDVRASSPTGRTTDPRVVVGRQFVRTNFAGPRYVNGVASSWWQVDLGEQHQLAITYYTLRHDGSPDYARSWVLQGSHDLVSWVDLKRHSNDTAIKLPGQYASWPVIGPAAAVPYRAFRLLLTAPNASPNAATRHNFCLSNLELYGFLHKGNGGQGGGSGGQGSGGQGGSGSGTGGQGSGSAGQASGGQGGGSGGQGSGSGGATCSGGT